LPIIAQHPSIDSQTMVSKVSLLTEQLSPKEKAGENKAKC